MDGYRIRPLMPDPGGEWSKIKWELYLTWRANREVIHLDWLVRRSH